MQQLPEKYIMQQLQHVRSERQCAAADVFDVLDLQHLPDDELL